MSGTQVLNYSLTLEDGYRRGYSLQAEDWGEAKNLQWIVNNQMKAQNILETIGNTPHVRINNLFGKEHEVWIKMEKNNPGASIKDRIALAMIEDAEAKGILKEGGVIVEPTSGNTGIGLAIVAVVKGYKLIVVMPESMSIERRRLMAIYGAE